MLTMKRPGLTLVELLVALTLSGIVGTLVFQTIIGSQRITRAQMARVEVQQTVRSGAFYLGALLRELSASEGDILLAEDHRIRFRAMRWTGGSCTPMTLDGGGVSVTLRDAVTFGLRGPDVALDSLFVYLEGDPGDYRDDEWEVAGLASAAPGTCADGAAATVLGFTMAGGVNNADAITAFTSGSPLRGFQIEELSIQTDPAGDPWLARRTMGSDGNWTSIEPLIGPLEADGLRFAYFAADGSATTDATAIAVVGVTIRGRSMEVARTSGGSLDYIRDSIVTRVALRNNLRF